VITLKRRQMKILQYSTVLKKLGVLSEEEYENIKKANKLPVYIRR
jgi:hypothetical protein